jgi:eukaryotic-like serine/threonine-protein kinase
VLVSGPFCGQKTCYSPGRRRFNNMNLSQAEEIFHRALELKDGGARTAYLDSACTGQPGLRAQVEHLLAAHEAPSGFLDTLPEETRTTASPMEETLGSRIGRYKVLEKVGEGGCGVVYVAEQTEPVRRRVALKVIKLGMDTKAVVVRFEAERQALAMMDHPNIAKVLDAGTTETGRPYFVMELVRGIRITDYCDQNNLSTKDRLDLFIKICQAIQHAHQKGIIHRDIKPSNILITLHDGVAVPKVIDFGIAKATEGRLTDATVYTQLHQFIGTPAYMSPEQAEMSGLDIDTRSDIYSLGVLLYEFLTGLTPFNAQELVASGIDGMRKTIREEEPVRPSTKVATLQGEDLTTTAKRRSLDAPGLVHLLKGDLDWIVMKCLEKDRTRRYETANGLAADLRRYLTNEPVVARPPGTLYRVQKLVRRNKLAFAAGSSVAAAIVIGFVMSAWSFVKERQARQRAVVAEQRAEAARNNEAGLRQQAEQSATTALVAAAESRRTLAESDFQQALRFIGEDKTMDAAAHLARSVSLQPAGPAGERLASLLANRSWLVPTVITSNSYGAALSSDGARVATSDADGTAVLVFDGRTARPLLGPLPHGSGIRFLRFTPDGKYLLTGSGSKGRCWDARTGEAVGESVTFDQPISWEELTRDGKLALLSFSDGSVRVVEVPSLKVLSEIKHDSPVQAAGFLDDERIVASTTGAIHFWDARTGLPVMEPLKHKFANGRISVSTNGARIVSFGGVAAQVWDVPSRERIAFMEHLSGVINSAKLSPDGLTVLTGGSDRTVRLWDASTGASIGDPLRHDQPVYSAWFSPDGNLILAWLDDGSVHIWNVRTRQRMTAALKEEGRQAWFSDDGRRIITTSAEGLVRVWDFWGAPQLPIELQHPALPHLLPHGENRFPAINNARFSPDGKRIVTTALDQTTRFWDAATGRPLALVITNANLPRKLEFSSDGGRLLTLYHGSYTARIWNLNSGRPVGDPLRHSTNINHAQFSPDGSRVVTVSDDKTARLWDAINGRSTGAVMAHDSCVTCADFSSDGRRVVTGSKNGQIRFWDANTGGPLSAPFREPFEVDRVRFSPDGTKVATSSGPGVHFWDTRSGQKLRATLGHNHNITWLEFSPDGTRILTASWDGTARLWDVHSGVPLTLPLRHAKGVWFATFAPDGSRVVTASSDETAQVWDVATGQPVSEPLRHIPQSSPSIGVQFAQFSPDGRRVLTAGRDAVRVWDLPPNQTIPEWLPELAEMIAGKSLRVTSGTNDVRQRLAKLKAHVEEMPSDPWNNWGRWLLSDPRERPVSLFSKIELDDYIEKTLRSPSTATLSNLEQFARGNADLLARIDQAQRRLDAASAPDKLYREGMRLRFHGKPTESFAKVLEAANLGYAVAQNSVAWTLATSTEEKIRDGHRAIEFALKALAGSDRREPGTLDTLACAYAEIGDFKNAILTLEEAMQLPMNNPTAKRDYTAHLESFKAGQPWRED